MGLTAWGDESIRMSAPKPTYLLAATVMPDDFSISALKALKPKGAPKLHWRDLSDKGKLRSLDSLSGQRIESVIVAAAPVSSSNPERARRKCLATLLSELERRGIARLCLESRTLKMDRRDTVILPALRAMGAITTIELEHLLPSEEPRLWVPDQVVGAYGDMLCATRGSTLLEDVWAELEQKTTVIELSI